MSHQSLAKIEYVTGGTAYTVVDVGDFLSAPLQLAAQQSLFEADGVLAPASYFRPLGGAVITISFAIDREFQTRGEATTEFLSPDRINGVSMLAPGGVLRITIDGEVTEFEKAVLVSPDPSLPSGPDSITATAYQFVASAVPLPA